MFKENKMDFYVRGVASYMTALVTTSDYGSGDLTFPNNYPCHNSVHSTEKPSLIKTYAIIYCAYGNISHPVYGVGKI